MQMRMAAAYEVIRVVNGSVSMTQQQLFKVHTSEKERRNM